MELLRFKDMEMGYEFIQHLCDDLKESVDINNEIIQLLNKFPINDKYYKDLYDCFNTFCIFFTELLTNDSYNIDLNNNTLTLITYCTLLIAYNDTLDDELLKKYVKGLLEELRLHGVGNDVIKTCLNSIYSLFSIFSILYNDKKDVFKNIIDVIKHKNIFKYTISSVIYLIRKYDIKLRKSIKDFSVISTTLNNLIHEKGKDYVLANLHKNAINIDTLDELDNMIIEEN